MNEAMVDVSAPLEYVAALKTLETEIEALAEIVYDGPKTAMLSGGRPYVTFVYGATGGLKREGDDCSPAVVESEGRGTTAQRVFEALLDAVRQWKTENAPDARYLAWRLRPQVIWQPAGAFDPEKFQFRLRLLFES